MSTQISVIIPAYNEEKNIKKCLQSLKAQTFPENNFEIILIDNNCQDKTVEIASSFKVRVIKEKKQGITYARIKGINNSLAPIVAFLDADSSVNPNWLDFIYQTLSKTPKLVGIGFEGNLEPKNRLVKIAESFLHWFYFINPVMPGYCFSFKKEVYFACGGFKPEVKFGEDVFISKKLKRFGKIMVKPGFVTTSSRRYLNFLSLINYAYKTIISFIAITLFDKSPVELKAFSKEKFQLNLLKNKNFPGNSLTGPEENN
ncbi:glycosyltransferase [Candidatus Microgenomates bacterium]|jgi:glycosyltransferase involved in cell wall biosynthesis|nr:MAG: glycosyltransferase [Candidatus Microgenomates bacterium]